jgi:hypothetical protein
MIEIKISIYIFILQERNEEKLQQRDARVLCKKPYLYDEVYLFTFITHVLVGGRAPCLCHTHTSVVTDALQENTKTYHMISVHKKKKLCMCPLVIYRVLSHYGSECLKNLLHA